jgi:hypothetical protein
VQQDCSANINTSRMQDCKKSLGIRPVGSALELVVDGYGNCHDTKKTKSKIRRRSLGFQLIGSRVLPGLTLIVRPVTFLGTVGASSLKTAINS